MRIGTLLPGLLAAVSLGADAQTQPADIPANLFAQLPLMNDAALSPDGTHIAYLRPVKGRDYLIIQELGSGARPSAIPPDESTDFDWLRWASDERIVFCVSFAGKRFVTETTETRLGSVDRSGSDIQWIVRPGQREVQGRRVGGADADMPPPQIQDRIVDWMPGEPNRILVAIDDDFDGGYSVRRIDVDSGVYRDVVAERSGIQSWLSDQDGGIRLGFGFSGDRFKVRLNVAEDEWIDADKTDWWDQGYWPEAFTEDPGVAFMSGPNDDGVEVIRKMRLADGEFLETVFEHETYDAGSLVNDPVTGHPVGVSYVEDSVGVHYFDPTWSGMQKSLEKAFAGADVSIASMSHDRQRVLVLVSSTTDPGVWYLWDRGTKQIAMVAEKMPGLKPEWLSPVEAVTYEASDGTPIPAYLTVPKGAEGKNLPVVVMPHGGPRARSDASFWFLTQFLASRGYAVMQPNFRGSTGYGRYFEYAGRKQWGGLMQDDVSDGAAWLIEQGIADPDRMCIAGWSYGGYAAAMATVKTPDLFACAISINGVLNLPKLIADDHRYHGGSSWTEHMGLDGGKAKAVSPHHQVERITTPILLVQAEDDRRVSVEHAEDMAKALRKQKKEYELVKVDFGGHTMRNEAARTQVLEATEAFLAKHIGGR